MKYKDDNIGTISSFLLAIVIILWGIKMIAKNLVAVGVSSRTLSLSGFGGEYLILMGLILLFVAYHGLSPLGKIRRFLEGDFKKKDKQKQSKK
ncbi:hypothetical protein [Pontibacter burrus]|uniref:Uncharacterized protein n=1 Tax=Pontibacter burrus TaxID=2704466 RepID=A0A6B3LP22_9BACT|nr:hypothetical protein [Pontibacter burrus]NEM98652.1 hypothetical protein [Pontibacter burrus]